MVVVNQTVVKIVNSGSKGAACTRSRFGCTAVMPDNTTHKIVSATVKVQASGEIVFKKTVGQFTVRHGITARAIDGDGASRIVTDDGIRNNAAYSVIVAAPVIVSVSGCSMCDDAFLHIIGPPVRGVCKALIP